MVIKDSPQTWGPKRPPKRLLSDIAGGSGHELRPEQQVHVRRLCMLEF